MGGATRTDSRSAKSCDISIHAPRGRSDLGSCSAFSIKINFNPRPSWEERLRWRKFSHIGYYYFNPRPSWEERLTLRISDIPSKYFNPRPSWEERQYAVDRELQNIISIHAPRGRSDCICVLLSMTITDFNPRPSWEERRLRVLHSKVLRYFNPRPSWEERH